MQRADAGREVEDAKHGIGLQPRHQRVHTEAQVEVEHQRAIFDEQVLVAGAAVDDRHRVVGLGDALQHRFGERIGSGRERGRGLRGKAGDGVILRRFHALGLRLAQSPEAHGVAGTQLAHLPQLGLHDGRRADEAAKAGAVRAEDHRHVAGEVDRADRIGVVVDV